MVLADAKADNQSGSAKKKHFTLQGRSDFLLEVYG